MLAGTVDRRTHAAPDTTAQHKTTVTPGNHLIGAIAILRYRPAYEISLEPVQRALPHRRNPHQPGCAPQVLRVPAGDDLGLRRAVPRHHGTRRGAGALVDHRLLLDSRRNVDAR